MEHGSDFPNPRADFGGGQGLGSKLYGFLMIVVIEADCWTHTDLRSRQPFRGL